jgi:hypothetical protein
LRRVVLPACVRPRRATSGTRERGGRREAERAAKRKEGGEGVWSGVERSGREVGCGSQRWRGKEWRLRG